MWHLRWCRGRRPTKISRSTSEASPSQVSIGALHRHKWAKKEENMQKKPELQHLTSNSFITGYHNGCSPFTLVCKPGWSRYDHFASLCELLPVAVPRSALPIILVATFTITVTTITISIVVVIAVVRVIMIFMVVVQPCRQPARSFLGISSAAGLSQVSFHQWCSD